jgi:replicative DNA helicase
MGIGQAAANNEILADIEGYEDWMLPRVDIYADLIKKFALRDRAAKLGWKLQKVAQDGDLSQIDTAVIEINKNISLQSSHKVTSLLDPADRLEARITERARNPVDVWGIPYAWDYLSRLTGGKQPGELTLLAGEPGVGKSYFALQDILESSKDYPAFLWSGEMKEDQIIARMYQLLGVNGKNMRTGKMQAEDWNALRQARAIVLNTPIYIDDSPMPLHELRAVLQHQKAEHGIKQYVLDYAFLVDAPGKDEIEKTSNVSRTVKLICKDLDLAGTLISSVSKMGMDTNKAGKGHIRGSGQQIHDADNIFTLTTFAQTTNDRVALRFQPHQYDRLVSLHFNKGRELDHTLPGGVLHFSRLGTKFKEELQ